MRRVAGRACGLRIWILAGLVAFAQGEARAQEIGTAAWLAGCWLASSGSTETEEVWLRPKGGVMLGVSRVVREGVATSYELLRLSQVEGRLVLSAYPSGQEPADFGLARSSAGSLRFENPSHDFPRVIEYERVAADTLLARVFADTEASTPSFVVRYARMRCEGNQGVG